MGLLDEIKQAQPQIGGRCSVPVLLDSLPKDDRADVETALADATIPSTVIAKVLGNHGHRIGASSLQRHRRGVCLCGNR